MTFLSYLAVLIVGYIGGLLSRRRVATIIEEHTHMDTRSRLPGPARAWLIFGTTLLILAAASGYGAYRGNQAAVCVKTYVSGSAPLTTAYQDALQEVVDDTGGYQVIAKAPGLPSAIATLNQGILKDHPLPATADLARVEKALSDEYFSDKATEHDAYQKLKDYRHTHVPSKACPS